MRASRSDARAGQVVLRVRHGSSEVRERGDKMVAVGIWRTRGRSSGVPMETPVATLIEFMGAEAIRLRTYLDPDEGLESAGLSD